MAPEPWERDDDAAVTGWRPGLSGGAPPVHGSDVWTAVLPSGRVSWLALTPELAPVQGVNELAAVAERLEERRGAALEALRREVLRRGRGLDEAARRVLAAHSRRHRRLSRALVQGDARLARRATEAIRARRARDQERVRLAEGAARRLVRRTLWDELVVASALPLFAAFGRRESPLAEDNVALALLGLVWLLGDEVTDLLAGERRPAHEIVRQTDLWTYLAPLANLATGWLLLHGEQHERFVSGIAELAPARPLGGGAFLYEQPVPLAPIIAPDHFPDFVTFADVPAVATAVAPAPPRRAGIAARARVGGVTARVNQEALELATAISVDPPDTPPQDVEALVPSVRVAWLVDTKDPNT